MPAFHGSEDLKARKLVQVRAHEAADEIIKGKYWEGGKGCAVGCTVHSSSHAAYETEMGIPRLLARLEDRIFEGMTDTEAKRFPMRFIDAIPVGADLSLAGWQFLHWLIVDVTERHGTEKTKEDVAAAIEVLRRKSIGEHVSNADVFAARERAFAARRAAADAAAAYADAAAYAAAAYADAAAYAADAAADAYAADYAADAAAYDADADAARRQAYDRQAEKLLTLLAAAPVVPPEA